MMSNTAELTGTHFAAFEHLRLPVWLFSIETLRILKANRAAQEWVGYDENTLQTQHITDLCAEAEHAKIIAKVRSFDGQFMDAGAWTIVAADGRRRTVPIFWSKSIYEGAEVIVASVTDASGAHPTKDVNPPLGSDLETQLQHAGLRKNEFQRVFDEIAGMMMVLTPDRFEIIAISDEYARALGLDSGHLLGQPVLDVFSADMPQDSPIGAKELKASLDRVQSLHLTDVMKLQRQAICRQDGAVEERSWLPHNKPVFAPDGKLQFIIHQVADVTDMLDDSSTSLVRTLDLEVRKGIDEGVANVALQTLQEREKRLAAAESLFAIGSWEMDLRSGALHLSDRVFEIFGLSPECAPVSIENYLALIHPDDREKMLVTYRNFVRSDNGQLQFEHRVVRSDGSMAHIRAIGACHTMSQREILIGVVQDITRDEVVEEEFRQSARRRELTSRLANVGHWWVDAETRLVTWSAKTAAIHDQPTGTRPTLDEAIKYHLPDHRERMRQAVENCLSAGISFDEICEMETAQGRRVWVRDIGEPVRNEQGRIIAIEGAFQDISDLMEARYAALAGARRLHRMIENISDGFYILDSEWRFSFLNSQAEELLGASRDELLEQNVWDVFPEALHSMRPHFEQALATNENTRFETKYDPSGKWYEVAADPTPEGLAVYFRDVTALRDAQQRLEMVIDGAQIGTWEWELSKRETKVNSVWCAMLGRSNAQNILTKEDFAQLLHPDDIGQTEKAFENILHGNARSLDITQRLRHANGHWVWIQFRGRVVLEAADGRATHLSGVALDVTKQVEREQALIAARDALARALSEREAAQKRLKANEERFQFVTRAAGTVVWEWDVTNNRDWWSEGFSKVFGHLPDDADSEPAQWMKHIHPDDKPHVDASIMRLVEGETEFAHENYRFRRADGSWAHVEDHSFAIRDSEGRVIRVLGSMTDVSEKVQLEERLRQSQKMEAVGQLTGGIAHDFNNLLTIILGNAELLSEDLEDLPALKRLADMTMGAAERGAELTGRLLAFSRKQVLAPKVMDPGKLLLEMDGLLRRTLPETIDIEIIRTGGLWKAELDAGQLEAALLNLALNARDAMPDGGCLTLESSNAFLDDDYVSGETGLKAGQYVLLTITDTGHGIEKELVQRVFEPFFTTKQSGKGSGLGLSMVYGFVKQSGGHIRVYSEPGNGTSFKLYFPRAFQRSHASEESAPIKRLEGGNEKIFVVEDEENVREHVLSQLTSLGYDVLTAGSGAEAHRILAQGLRVDLLFTDVIMPGGMSGFDLAEKARKLQPELRVLFTSGYTDNSIVHNAKLDHGIELLSKPYRREQLAAKIRKVLDTH